MTVHRKVLKKVASKTPYVKDVMQDRINLRLENAELQHKLSTAFQDTRAVLSKKYLRGEGIEIGALHMPLPLHQDAHVKYVDYMSVKGLRTHYPELKDLDLVDVAIVDNGEKLTKVKNNSVDFIIANHFFEHCQDPIGTLTTFARKLRDDGILYMAIPDKRYTFDMYRPLTTYAHLEEEHKAGSPKKFYLEHTKEIVRLTELVTDKKQAAARVKELADINYSIHYHVWTQKELVDFFYTTNQKYKLNFEIDAMANNMHEVIFVLRKRSEKNEQKKIRDIEKHYFAKKDTTHATKK